MDAWFALALVTAMLWGVGAVFSKASTPKLGVARVALIIAALESTMYAGAFFLWRDSTVISAGDAALAAVSCLAGITGYLCFFESIMEGQVAIAGTISAAYPALAVVGALLFLSEELDSLQAVGVVAVIGGVIGLSYERNPGAPNAMNRRSLMFALLAFGLWGFWSVTSKVAVEGVGAGNLFAFYAVCAMTAPLIYLWLKRFTPVSSAVSHTSLTPWLLGAVGIAINVSGTYTFSFALEEGNASLVVPIASAYPIVTIVLAVAVLKEKIDWLHALAIAAVVSGLVVLGLNV